MNSPIVVLGVAAWAGFVHSLLNRSVQVDIGSLGSASLPEVGVISIGALVCGLLSFLAALQESGEDLTSGATWTPVFLAAVPFFGMLYLLNPFGVGP